MPGLHPGDVLQPERHVTERKTMAGTNQADVHMTMIGPEMEHRQNLWHQIEIGLLRPLWTNMPFSRNARYRRTAARFVAADAEFRVHLRAEIGRLGFNARRAEQTVLEEMLDQGPTKREPWVNEGIIGYGTRGEIAVTTATNADAPEVVEVMRRFKELAVAARRWPDFIERQQCERRLKP